MFQLTSRIEAAPDRISQETRTKLGKEERHWKRYRALHENMKNCSKTRNLYLFSLEHTSICFSFERLQAPLILLKKSSSKSGCPSFSRSCDVLIRSQVKPAAQPVMQCTVQPALS